MELLADHPIFPSLLLEDASASAAGAALTPSGPRAPPLLWGINGTRHPTISAHKQQDQPPQKVLCWHPLALHRDLLSCCHLFKVSARDSRFSPASVKQPLFVTTHPQLSHLCQAATVLPQASPALPSLIFSFFTYLGYQHQECHPSSQESRRAALAAEAVPPPPRHLQPPPSGTRSRFISSLLGLG